MFKNYLKNSFKYLNSFNIPTHHFPININNNIIKRTFANHKHKKMIKEAKGYFGRVNLYAVAKRRVEKARMYAYRDRKVRNFLFFIFFCFVFLLYFFFDFYFFNLLYSFIFICSLL